MKAKRLKLRQAIRTAAVEVARVQAEETDYQEAGYPIDPVYARSVLLLKLTAKMKVSLLPGLLRLMDCTLRYGLVVVGCPVHVFKLVVTRRVIFSHCVIRLLTLLPSSHPLPVLPSPPSRSDRSYQHR